MFTKKGYFLIEKAQKAGRRVDGHKRLDAGCRRISNRTKRNYEIFTSAQDF